MALPAKIGLEESDSIAPPPDSGVRESLGRVALPPRPPLTDRLSYSIYTAAELESHIVESQRMVPPPIPVPRWPDLSVAGREAGQSLLAWARLPKPRPRVMDVCRPQLETLGLVTKGLLKTVPWKRLAGVTGTILGCIAVLLFAVITVGELTDDVKPKRAESSLALKATTPVPTMTASAPSPIVVAPVVTAAPSFEIVEAPAAPVRAPKAKKKHGKRPGAERFVP